MTAQSQTQAERQTQPPPPSQVQLEAEPIAEKILCPHCRRTATNGIKCKGICVADNDY
ncbi:MAG: hypothetical protein AAGF24_07390 [Cyanobacteria bacterium P01_H01_bin.121]